MDLNTRLFTFLKTHFTEGDGADLATMITRYLASLSGDYNNRWATMVADAS